METIQTRAEHSRSLEDAERFQALETLTRLGMLIPVSEVETFHGRARSPAEEEIWAVDPTFANGGNDSGNYNVYARPVLYTSDKATAQEFADARKANLEFWNTRKAAQIVPDATHNPEGRYDAEVHEIVSSDPDARILDMSFDYTKLTKEEQKEYAKALRKMIVPLSQGSPLAFQDRASGGGAVRSMLEHRNKDSKQYIDENEISTLAAEYNIPENAALQMSSSFNALRLSLFVPGFLVGQLVHRGKDIVVQSVKMNGEDHHLPINLEYVERYLSTNHIVGLRQTLSSATISKAISAVSFFNLEKTMTRNTHEFNKLKVAHKLGRLSVPGKELAAPESDQPLLRILDDAHAKPKTLMEAARQVGDFGKIFDADAGNWEGFTLAEHTETVLRNFEESYADDLPVDLLKPMRLAIIIHDIGKSVATAEGRRHAQRTYNHHYAVKFMDELKINGKTQEFLLALIGDSQQMAFDVNVRHGSDQPLKEFASQTLKRLSDDNGAKPAEVSAFVELAKILQICDGGAYTSIAVTRSDRHKIHYRNAPSFNDSFAQPHGPGKRALKPRKAGDASATPDLTPQGVEPVSRLKINRQGAGYRTPVVTPHK